MSDQPTYQRYNPRTNIQIQPYPSSGTFSKQAFEFSGQNKGQLKKQQNVGNEYQNVQQPNPSEFKGVSNNYFGDTKQQGNSSQPYKYSMLKKQQSIPKQKNEQKLYNQRQSINSKGKDEQKQILKEFIKQLYHYETGEQFFKRANSAISEQYLKYMKSISRKIQQSKSIQSKLLNLQKTLRQISSSKEFSKSTSTQLILNTIIQMTNTKKAFDKIIDSTSNLPTNFSTEFFNKDDIDKLIKLNSLKKQKAVESPSRQVKQLSNSTYLIKYTQDSLNKILTNKYSPQIDTLKNHSPQMHRVINNFYIGFNDLINKKQSPKKPQNQPKKTQKLMENIANDVMAIRKQKSLTHFYQSYARKLISNELPEKLYEQIKKYYIQMNQKQLQRPQTGKQPTKNPNLLQKQQSSSQQQDNRQLFEQLQQAKQKIINLQKQNASLKGESIKTQNQRGIKVHVVGGTKQMIRMVDNKKQSQNSELLKKYADELAGANQKIAILEKDAQDITKKLQNEFEKTKRQIQQQNAKIIQENQLLKNQISQQKSQIQSFKAEIDRLNKDKQGSVKGQQQESTRLRQENTRLKQENYTLKTKKSSQIQQLKAQSEKQQKLRQQYFKHQQAKNAQQLKKQNGQQLRKQKQAFQFYKKQSQRQLASTKSQLQQKQLSIKNYKGQVQQYLRQRQQRSKRILQLQQQLKEQQDKNAQSSKRISLLQQNNRNNTQPLKKVELLLRDKDILQRQNKQYQKSTQQLRLKLRVTQTKANESQKIIDNILNKPVQQTPKQRQLQQKLAQNYRKYQQQLQELKDKNIALSSQKANTELKTKSLQTQINELNKAISEANQRMNNLGRQRYTLQQKNQQLSSQNITLRRQSERASPSRQQMNEIMLLKQQLRFRDQTISSLNNKIMEQEGKLNQLQTQNMGMSQQLINQRKEIEALQSKIYDLQRNTGQLKEKDRLQKKTKDQEKEILNLKGQIAKLSQVAKDKEINSLRLQIQELSQRQQVNNRQREKLKGDCRSLEQKIKLMQVQCSRLKQSINSVQQQLKKKEARIVQLSRQSQSSKQISTTIKRFQQQKPRQISNSSRLGLLQHQLLHNRQQDKQFLLRSIQSHIGLKVVHTKLIYCFDLLNKTNFHHYIDHIPNILVIIKLQNGYIAAAYSQGAFIPRKQADKDGLIFSVTNRKMFLLAQPNRKAISYDEYFLIFGNSEIRLRSLQNKLFSNFGINNGYYASKGEKVSILLGEGGEREVDLQTYQIYQLTFA